MTRTSVGSIETNAPSASQLRLPLRSRRKQGKSVALPSLDGGGALVDIVDRDALYQDMEGR